MPAQPELLTERLLLRPFRASDGPDVQRLAGAHEVADMTMTVPHPYPDGAAEAWIATHAKSWDEGTAATYAIIERTGGHLVGAVGLHIVRAHALAELGYWIGVPFWNRGYASESSRSLIELGFSALALHRIQARHFLRNPASGRVMQKLGMTLEGVMRGAARKWDRFEDLAMYAILAPEWKERGGR